MQMNKIGTILTGRSLGKDVREAIMSQPGIVDVDFAGIEVVTHSFCDEAFGKMIFEVDHPKNKVKFLNANDTVKAAVKHALTERINNSHVKA